MPNILAVIDGLATGGTERMLVNLVNHMDHHRFQTTVVSLSEDNPLANSLRPGSSDFVKLPRKWRYDFSPVRSIRKLIHERKIDTIICLDMFEFFFVRQAMAGIRRPPQVIIAFHSTLPRSRKMHYLRHAYKQLLTGSERLIAVCHAQANYWNKTYHIPLDRFTVIYNGIDVNYFHSNLDPDIRLKIRRQQDIPVDAVVIALTGVLRPEKRHEDALLALQHIFVSHPYIPVYLMLVGGGSPERVAVLRALASSLGIADRVRFCGPQNDVRPFYHAADIFTLTSSTVETFSIAALEAMAMGLPCVLTDIGGAREMIVEGVNGTIVPPEEPLLIAIGWQRIIERLSSFDKSAIRSRMTEKFTIEHCTHQYEQLLNIV